MDERIGTPTPTIAGPAPIACMVPGSAAMVLGSVGMALHHKLCHTLGGGFNLPHAETHAVVLPHAIAYNSVAVPDAAMPICRALGATDGNAGGALFDLAKSLGAPYPLQQLGMSGAEIERAADLALQRPYWNPRSMIATGSRMFWTLPLTVIGLRHDSGFVSALLTLGFADFAQLLPTEAHHEHRLGHAVASDRV